MAKVKLNIVKQELEGSRIQLNVSAPAETVKEASKSVAKQILRHMSIPGFRRDKTPLALVKRQVGADRFLEYVQSELLPSTYYEAVDQEGIQPISEVQYGEKSLTDSEFKFQASFAVAPAFQLGDYKNLKVEASEAEPVTDDAVDNFLQQLRSKHSVKNDVAEGVEIKSGDLVSLLIRGKIGEEESPFLKHYNVSLVIGENQLYPDFDKHLLGHKKLDRFEVEHAFGDDYFNKALSGKTAKIEIKVLTHKTVTLPEMDSEFLKSLGGFETVDALKAAIRKEIENSNKEAARKKLRANLQDSLYTAIQCDVPKGLVGELSDAKLHDLKLDLEQKKSSFEDFLTSQGKTEEEYKAEVDKASEKELKLSFALTRIADQEGLGVEEEEVSWRIRYTAMVLRKEFHEILEFVENLGRRVLIRAEIKQEKALHFLENLYFPAETESAVGEEASAEA